MMNSKNKFKLSWMGAAKWLAVIVVIALSGTGGFATVNALIAYGEMKSEARRNGDSLATLDEKLTELVMSQTRMERKMDVIFRFILETISGNDSASLNRDESETSVPVGMAVHCG